MEQANQQSNKHSNFNFLTILKILGTIGIFFIIQQFREELNKSSIDKISLPVRESKIDEQFIEMAMQLNKTCPRTLDEDTRLDSVKEKPIAILQGFYTLINYSQKEVDTTNLKLKLKEFVINKFKANPTESWNTPTWEYYYMDKNGNYLFQFIVTPAMLFDK